MKTKKTEQTTEELRASELRLAEARVKYAEDQGADLLRGMVATLERALREVQSYRERYAEAESTRDRVNVLSWTVNHMATSVLNNMRLDLAVTAAAELSSSAVQLEQAKAGS